LKRKRERGDKMIWLKFLTPKNIMLGLVIVLVLGLVIYGKIKNNSLKNVKAELVKTQQVLAGEQSNLKDCRDNVVALVEQYNQSGKTTAETERIKKRIIDTAAKKDPTKKEPAESNKEPAQTTNQAETDSIKEAVNERNKEYREAIVDISNLLYDRFNGSMFAQTDRRE
jgi:hypothetical protein